MPTLDKWIAFAEPLLDVAARVFDKADDIKVTERQFLDRPVLAVTLLSRTFVTYRAVMMLARAGLVVEARTLVRSCYENLFLAVALAEKDDGIIEDMRRDERTSRIAIMDILHKSHAADADDNDPIARQLKERLDWMKARTPKKGYLKPANVVNSTSILEGYLVYKNLSRDAAHPSLTALRRHIVGVDESGAPGLDVQPVAKAEEMIQTLDLATIALMSTCAAVEDILGHERSPGIADAFIEHGRLNGMSFSVTDTVR